MSPIRNHYLIFSAFFVVHTACGSKAEFEGANQTGFQYKTATATATGSGTVTETSTATTASAPESNLTSEPASSDLSTSHTTVSTQNSGPAQTVNPAVTPAPLASQSQKEAEVNAIALPPSVVAGAYLSCLLGVDKNSFVCVVNDTSGNPRAVPKEKQNTWSFTPTGSTTTVPLTPVVKESTSSGTIFYLSIAGQQSGSINFGGETVPAAFEISPLFQPNSTIVRYANPVASVTPSIVRWTASSDGSPVFGDGNLASEKDSCLGAGPVANAVAGGQIIIDASAANDLGSSSAYLENVCGLQSSNVFVLVEGQAPFKPIKVFLPPETPNIKIFENVDMPHARYTFTIRSASSTNGGRDDFSVAALSIVPAVKDFVQTTMDFVPL